MADRGIIFSAPMVRALLDGRKTQTRRFLTPACDEPPAFVRDGAISALDENDIPYRWPRTKAVGDRLYVREAHALVPSSAYRMSDGVEQTIDPADRDRACIYRESWIRSYGGLRWRPSIHMPRWASRLTLLVTEVRVQRLQEISEADAVAEGGDQAQARMYPELGTCRHWFEDLWNSLHGTDAWQDNPWVCALTFTVHRCNIVQMPGGGNA